MNFCEIFHINMYVVKCNNKKGQSPKRRHNFSLTVQKYHGVKVRNCSIDTSYLRCHWVVI